MELLYLAIGFIVGGIGAYFLAKFRLEALASRRLSYDEIRKRFVVRELYETLDKQFQKTQAELANYQRDLQVVSSALAAKEQYAENVREKLVGQKREITALQARFKTEFENIANRLLEEKSAKFVQQNQTQLDALLNPLKEKIKAFEDKVEKTYWEEAKDRISLKEEITKLRELNMQLSTDANALANALKGDVKTQGDWGEYRLELILERAGLVKNVHYQVQSTFKDDKGNQKRPDFIINLPEKKHLIIDSKVSLKAYEAFYNAENEEELASYLKAHINSLRQHIRDLSSKNYQNLYQINSPDYLLMFVPIEPALNLAMENDTSLFLQALDRNIVMVSTSTLLATMRTVAYIWKQDKQRQSVLEIAKQSGLLYDKFVAFVEDLQAIGYRIEQTQAAYHGAMNKLVESKKFGDTLVGRAERIRKLGANATKRLPQELVDRVGEEGLLE